MRAPTSIMHTRKAKKSRQALRLAKVSRRNWRVYRPPGRQLARELEGGRGGSAVTRVARLREYHVLDQCAEGHAGKRSLHRAVPFPPHRNFRVFAVSPKSPMGTSASASGTYCHSDLGCASPDAHAMSRWGAIMLAAGQLGPVRSVMDRCGEAPARVHTRAAHRPGAKIALAVGIVEPYSNSHSARGGCNQPFQVSGSPGRVLTQVRSGPRLWPSNKPDLT
jgi:hypothetical protein